MERGEDRKEMIPIENISKLIYQVRGQKDRAERSGLRDET